MLPPDGTWVIEANPALVFLFKKLQICILCEYKFNVEFV